MATSFTDLMRPQAHAVSNEQHSGSSSTATATATNATTEPQVLTSTTGELPNIAKKRKREVTTPVRPADPQTSSNGAFAAATNGQPNTRRRRVKAATARLKLPRQISHSSDNHVNDTNPPAMIPNAGKPTKRERKRKKKAHANPQSTNKQSNEDTARSEEEPPADGKTSKQVYGVWAAVTSAGERFSKAADTARADASE